MKFRNPVEANRPHIDSATRIATHLGCVPFAAATANRKTKLILNAATYFDGEERMRSNSVARHLESLSLRDRDSVKTNVAFRDAPPQASKPTNVYSRKRITPTGGCASSIVS